MTEEIKIKSDPLFCLRLGPKAGFTITENDDWINLPPGTYKLEAYKGLSLAGLDDNNDNNKKYNFLLNDKPAYFLMVVKQDEKN